MQDSKNNKKKFSCKKKYFCDKHFIALWQNGICLFMVCGEWSKKAQKIVFFAIG
jgi:hypothetical protein